MGRMNVDHHLIIESWARQKIVYRTYNDHRRIAEKIDNEAWSELLPKFLLKRAISSMFQSGTIHAIGGGMWFLRRSRIQTTYRVYDYNRTDDAGSPRAIFNKQKCRFRTVSAANQQWWWLTRELKRLLWKTKKFFTVWKYDQWVMPSLYLSPRNGVRRKKVQLTVDRTTYPIEKSRSFILLLELRHFRLTELFSWSCHSLTNQKRKKVSKNADLYFMHSIVFVCLQISSIKPPIVAIVSFSRLHLLRHPHLLLASSSALLFHTSSRLPPKIFATLESLIISPRGADC